MKEIYCKIKKRLQSPDLNKIREQDHRLCSCFIGPMKEIYCNIKKRLQNSIKFGLALLALVQAIHLRVVMTIPRNNTDFSGRVSCSTLLMGRSIKVFYIILLFIITFLTLDRQICNAQQPILCNNGFTYTNGSNFESNLNTVLNSLVQDTSQTGFNISQYGQSPDRIYGLLQCRGDTTADQCYNCSQEATTTIRQICGNAGGGLLWSADQYCFLQYGNYSFIGQLNTVDGYYLYNASNISSPDVFNQALKSLFANLSAEAAYGSKLYASGTTTDSLFRKIYGLVQCWRDLSSDDCTTCLSNTINSILINYAGRAGARGLMGSCIVGYDIYAFFNLSGLPPPAEAPSPKPLQANMIEPSSSNTFIICNHTVNYSSEYQSNLNKFLDSLAHEQWSLTGYNTYMSDQIYAIIRFSINATLEECNFCIQKALNTTRQNCTTAVGGFISLDVCSFRYESYNFLNLTAPPSATTEAPTEGNHTPSKEAPTEGNHTPSKEFMQPKKLGVVGGLLLALVVCLFATWRRLKTAIFRKGYEVQEQVEGDTPTSGDRQIVFKMEVLVAATENFHDDNKLGEGGFGPVYKGTIHGGKEIAVKKLSVNSMQGKREFLNEVKLVAKIQHRNLVKLLGYCAGGSETLLVYEYLPNKSLDQILFDPNKRKHLDWQMRYVIILGVARGLLYLHQDSQPWIIHRDIKASNILLDEKLNPKIADFGLAKLFPENQSHVSTKVAGTYGYMAPEYAMHGQLSAKADVYSFGVLLLELITGRKNTDYHLSPEMQMLLGWAWSSYERGNIVEMIDPSIIETCDQGQALRCIHVGLLCTQADSSLRPPMSTVTLMLSTDSVTLPDPTKPIVLTSNTQIINPTGSGSGATSSAYGSSSHASATTTSVSSRIPVVAPVSNAVVSITDLVPR